MRTVVHIAMILLFGIGLGLAFRVIRSDQASNGPGADETVFTNEGPPAEDPSDIQNSQPSYPPEDETWVSEFALTERSGETVSSDDLLGQPYVVSFFFSTCPSICMNQNRKLQELQEEFEGQGVRFVAISVDPETDTPEVLREYAARFGADADQWLFMTGDLTTIRQVGVNVFRQPVNKQFHTERFALVDADGEIEGFYNWPEPMQLKKLKEKIRDMISNKEA